MTDWRKGFKKYTGHECFVDGDKHNFQPRYSRKVIKGFELDPDVGITLQTIGVINEEYVYDVCLWCGKIAKDESK